MLFECVLNAFSVQAHDTPFLATINVGHETRRLLQDLNVQIVQEVAQERKRIYEARLFSVTQTVNAHAATFARPSLSRHVRQPADSVLVLERARKHPSIFRGSLLAYPYSLQGLWKSLQSETCVTWWPQQQHHGTHALVNDTFTIAEAFFKSKSHVFLDTLILKICFVII